MLKQFGGLIVAVIDEKKKKILSSETLKAKFNDY